MRAGIRVSAALALASLPLAACGGSKKSTTTATVSAAAATRAVHDAAAKTIKATTEHVQLSAAATTSGQSVRIVAQGGFDATEHSGSLHGSFSLSGTKTTVQEVVTGTTVYLSSPLFSAFLPAGKSWLKIDLAGASSGLGVYASALLFQDPAAVLGQLQALTGVQDLGAQQVGGTEATHYRGRVDAAKLSGPAAQAAQAAGAKFGALDVWVGADGYVRKLRTSVSAAASGRSLKTSVTMTLSSFGEAVTASSPPASQVVDSSKVSIPGLGG
jgi:LppX_LprAFG lipoprotein